MMRFSHSAASFSGRQPPTRSALRAWGAKGARIVLIGVAILVVPLAHAQPGRGFGLFASEAQDQGRPGPEVKRKDWRNTLDGQGRAGEGSPQRRKMSEEERSNLRQHLRDAAQGAYRDDSPPRKGRR